VTVVVLLFLTLHQQSYNFNIIAFIIIITLPLISIGSILVLIYSNYQIKYNDDSFIYRGIFRSKKQYNYNDVTGIIYDKFNAKLVISTGKKLTLQTFSVGRQEFIAAIEQWRKNNGKPSKKLPKVKEPLFNDNILDAEGFVAAWIMFIVFFGLFFLGILVMSLPKKDFQVAFYVGCLWLFFIISGPLFNFFISNAEKYPRISKLLVKPSYIKNPIVRQKLGLKPLRNK
jgi:ABC-type transport system involved in multi-copper enzyme maturation permease subunit